MRALLLVVVVGCHSRATADPQPTIISAAPSELRASWTFEEKMCTDPGQVGACDSLTLVLLGARSESRPLSKAVLPRPRWYGDPDHGFQLGCDVSNDDVKCTSPDADGGPHVSTLSLTCGADGKCAVRASDSSVVLDEFTVPPGTTVVFVKPTKK